MSEERKWYRVEFRAEAREPAWTDCLEAYEGNISVTRVVELVDGPEVKLPLRDTFADALERVAKWFPADAACARDRDWLLRVGEAALAVVKTREQGHAVGLSPLAQAVRGEDA